VRSDLRGRTAKLKDIRAADSTQAVERFNVTTGHFHVTNGYFDVTNGYFDVTGGHFVREEPCLL
jgi:hypothetical protein